VILSEPHPGAGTGTAEEPVRYRAHLDGLRAVAVYLVVAFHAGLGFFSGGFIGVDVFFVLSGFLVTQVLLRSLTSTGRLQARQFYFRRVRRILPAAMCTLVISAVVYSLVATPAEMLDALGGFRAAFLYVANWYFIRQSTDYFAANVNSSPVLQFWSLAIEEQFYLVWPLLLAAGFALCRRVGRWRWWALRGWVAAAGVASAILALHLSHNDLTRAYYGTDARAYQLLAGAVLAMTPQLLRFGRRPIGRLVANLSLVAVLILATSTFAMNQIVRGFVVTIITVLLLSALERSDGGLGHRVLSAPPMVSLGKISYGIYLWHWPVVVILEHERAFSPVTLFVTSGAIATALAALSFRLIERPIRLSRALARWRTPVIAAGFGTSILLGVFLMPAILERGDTTVAALPDAGRPPAERLLDWRVARNDRTKLPTCVGQPLSKCTVVTGSGPRVVLMGDSNAWMLIPTFVEIAQREHWSLTVAAYPTCPWEEGLQGLFPTRPICRAAQTDWYQRLIPRVDPDLVILAHQAFDDPERGLPFVGPDGQVARPGSPQLEPLLRDVTKRSLKALRRNGRKVVIMEPIPDAPADFDPLSCLSTGQAPATCTYRAETQPTPLERFYRTTARKLGATSVDLDHMVCPRWPTCDPVINDVIVKRDRNHLTATFARTLASQVSAELPDSSVRTR
jgi:peptidoglycan/LPS O-acetylase OafA/YrhL